MRTQLLQSCPDCERIVKFLIEIQSNKKVKDYRSGGEEMLVS